MSDQQILNPLFPVFLRLDKLHVLLAGAGAVGHEKLNAVLQNAPQARVTVVSKEISAAVGALAERYPNVHLQQKSFDPSDLLSKDLVIVALNNKEQSSYVRHAAKEGRLLVNVADTPELCDFYLASIVQKGDVKIAISTNGKSPTLAKRLKELLQEALPDSIHTLAGRLHAVRSRLKGNFSDKVDRLNRLTAALVEKENEETA